VAQVYTALIGVSPRVDLRFDRFDDKSTSRMAAIEKLSILGIRSFSTDKAETIQYLLIFQAY
jgi:hypothetical protein